MPRSNGRRAAQSPIPITTNLDRRLSASVVIMQVVQGACDKLGLQSPLYILDVDLFFRASHISSTLANVTLNALTVVLYTGCMNYRPRGPGVTRPSVPVVGIAPFNYL